MTKAHGGIVAEEGPVWILRSVYGAWRWWCSDCNATSMGSILSTTPKSELIRNPKCRRVVNN